MKNFIAFFVTMFSEFFYNIYMIVGAKVTKQVKIMYPEGVDMRGSSEGTTHSKNKSGNYLKKKAIPSQPRTSFQTAVRALFSNLSQGWRSLTAAQRTAWNAASQNFPQTNVFGLGFIWSGVNFFMSVGRNLQTIGLPYLSSPPSPGTTLQVSITALSADIALSTLNATYPQAIDTATSVVVYATQGVSAGKSNINSLYKKIGVLTDADASPKNLFALYTAKFGALPAAGQKLGVKFLPINETTGLPAQATSQLVITA
jgi:hypothetical protein